MPGPVTSVYAEYDNFTTPKSPFLDYGKMVLRMKSGIASCDMYFCNRVAYPSWELEVIGPKGVVTVRRGEAAGDMTAFVHAVDGLKPLPVPKRVPQWELFWVDALKKGKPAAVTAADACEITRLSLLAWRSARQGRLVKVS
jgi:predicted dehydrogenase